VKDKGKGRWIRSVGCFCLALAAIQLVVAIVGHAYFFRIDDLFAWDARMRHNEIQCAHEGVNSFYIWNRSVTHEKYKGLSRDEYDEEADKKMAAESKGAPKKLTVHSYPAWHTAYLWFVGWMSEPLFLGFLYTCFGLALVAFWKIISACAPPDSASRWLFFGLLAIPLPGRILGCFATGNYGLFMALLMFCLISAVDAKRTVYAGILWAVMMVKPQLAILLFWPLLLRKHYVAIGLAVAICVAGTVAISFVYGCSPITLIEQIPAIGAPYTSSPKAIKFLFEPILGPATKWVWSLAIFSLCGIMTWRLRTCGTWWLFLPAILLFPVWTYSQPHDGVAAWPVYAIIPLLLLSTDALEDVRHKKMVIAYGWVVISAFFVTTMIDAVSKPFPRLPEWCWWIFGSARVTFWVAGLFVFDRLAQYSKLFALPRLFSSRPEIWYTTQDKEEIGLC